VTIYATTQENARLTTVDKANEQPPEKKASPPRSIAANRKQLTMIQTPTQVLVMSQMEKLH
jgi:hypothetical protein